MDFETAKMAFILHSQCKGLSDRTVQWYEHKLRFFFEYIAGERADVGAICRADLVGYIHHLRSRRPALSAECIVGYGRTLSVFFRYLADEEFIEANPAVHLPLPKKPRKVIPTFTTAQLKKLLAQPNPHTYSGRAHYAMMYTLIDTGMRLSEMLNLKAENVFIKDGYVLVDGKGAKQRAVPIGKKLSKVFIKYLVRRTKVVFDDTFFVKSDGTAYKMSSFHQSLKRYGRRAGITGVRVSAHTFRHTFAKSYVLNGGDAFSLQKKLGHSTLDIVRIYVNMGAEDVRAQHRQFGPGDRL